ncbi:unnamed protein product [Cuscuta epithymum]|uniref:Remorin C-terminal domain-containing protein n=1 Tax=Cuscuta epithymum TaxID=186058 RepID=A0AAV0D0P3_9ASTE|nr:unnamed protein product [Cuscuta epithymum]CAH9124632.1 unnamed protein product [Cuscuta epithymum]
MRKSSTSFRNSGTYTSPSTPEYGDNHIGGVHKGWSSERVPLPTNSNRRRNVTSTALIPFSTNARAFPSKWDDAERWITSPLSNFGVCNPSAAQPHRHAKSKSGPLGTSGHMYMPNYSPTVPFIEGGGGIGKFTGSSPFTTGVIVPEGLCIHYGNSINSNANSLCAEKRITRAYSVPGLSDSLSDASSLPSSRDDKLATGRVAETDELHVVSRRDMATQMSPDESIHSSPKERSPLPSFPLPIPVEDEHNKHSAKVEIRDVQVDKGVSISNHSSGKLEKKSPNAIASSHWSISEATGSGSKEEARIGAWENLQKAKAEAAIQKLEMKLEKKRSASMNKILNRLRYAQSKAQEMRGAISKGHGTKVSDKARKRFKVSFGGCLSCRTR